ncbi:ABC transporter substrate-binding protein [Halobium salinum]|uniref:ABC transporter substrate-binding protein n=1 Tax=Halobium salinum TaxID=1364940 RepID=A0ABD5PCA9_9EURY|nr:ABC transporter substrate-binding protein [Halobium salinum]
MTDAEESVSRRRFLQATGGTAAAVGLAGCTGGNDDAGGGGGGDGTETAATNTTATTDGTTESGGEGTPEGTLNLVNATMDTLDPVAAADTASGEVIQQLYDGLTNYVNGTTAVEPLLAKGFEASDDYTTYTFDLQKGATFHDGSEVTAEDFVYAFERLAGSENSRRSYFILDSLSVEHDTEGEEYKPGSLAVEAVDDYTLKLSLSKPFHATTEMLSYSSFAAVPQGIVGDVEGHDGQVRYEQFATASPTGAGPFEFETWEQGTEAEVSRYDDYYDGDANVERIHWQIISDPNAAYNYGQNRNSDVVSIPTSKYDPSKVQVEETDDKGRKFGTYGPLRNGETAQYMAAPQIGTYYAGFNMQAVPKPVRQAFAYVLNQELMVDQVFKGRGQPAYHLTPPPIFPNQNYEQHAEEYPYGYGESNIEKAKQVMEEAGYGPNDQFELNWTQYDSNTWESMAKILRDQLSAAHVSMSIEKAPFSTLLKRGRNGNLEAYSLGWIADWPAPDNFMQLLNPPQTDTSSSDAIMYTNWSSETGSAAEAAESAYNEIVDNLAPTDAANRARNEATLAMEEANWEDVSVAPVYHSVDERFYYDWLEIEPFGGMGPSRQKYTDARITNGE